MNKGKKIAVRVISVVLTLVMLVSAIPIQAFAAEKSVNAMLSEDAFEEKGYFGDMVETNEEESKSAGENGAEPESAVILAEDTDKREENVKHFRMSDGTMQAAQYAEPVHFLKDGAWTDYDNTLTEVDADDEENEGRTLLKNKDLTNQTADYSVRLSKKTNGKKFVRIEKDGYKLSWYYVGANKSTAKVAKQSDDGDPTTLEKLSSTVLYKDVFKSTDLEYIIGSTGLKENLILDSKKAPREFTAEYKANGLTPVQIDDKTVELRAEDGTVVYTLTAPFMTDADGAYSDGVKLSLSDVKSNAFTLKILLDTAWLDAEDRAYPVTVDPALKTEQSVSNAQTAFVSAKYPNKCYLAAGSDDMGSLYVGNIDVFGRTETYIKFTKLPDIGIGSKVVDARLLLGLRKCEVGLQVNVKRLVNDWDEKTVTWNNGPYGEGIISDYLNFTPQTDVTHHQETEITDMVRGWYSGDYPNYGLSLTTDKTAAAKAWFFSIHYTTYYQNRPLMVVSYRNMSGYEDYWSYTNVSAGRGGVASVNNFTGNLVFSQAVTQGDGGNLMPVNLSLIFNANKGDAPYSYVGSRMQTNFHIYLREESGQLATNGYKYYLNDADGTKHWFWFDEKTPNDGKDEDGLGYKLQVITVGSDANDKSAKFVITDKDENKMYFNASGNLTQIRNASGISATMQYESVSGTTRIRSITDGAGRAYTFQYPSGNANLVESITDPAGRKTKFTYYKGTVTYITFADGKFVQMSYNYDDYTLTEIKGIDGTRTKISYDSSAQKRVKEINWGASDSELLEKYSFEYKQNSTKVTDILNRSYTYQFNDFGQTTGVVSDTDGSAQFFELNKGNDPKNNAANKLVKESRVLQTVTNYVVNPGFTRAYSDGYVNYVENTSNQSISIDSGKKNLTNNALKIYKAASNTGRVNAVQYVNGLAAGTYTFSAHVNTDGATLAGDAWVFVEVWNSTNEWIVSTAFAEHTRKTDGWERKSVTFDVPAGCRVRLILGFSAGGSGTVWYDDLQLEKGEGESTFNLVENSGFTNGTAQWSSGTTKTASGGLSGLPNCGYTNGDPTDRWRGISQQMAVAGKANDVYSFGAWVKAASVPIDNGTKADQANKPAFNLALHYYDANGLWKGCQNIPINADLKNQWQFISGEYIIPNDYYKICVELIYFNNVNTVSITGAFCYKEQYGQTYDYDKNGNVISAVDIAKTNSAFAYYGTQMSRMLNPSGSAYMYTYNDKKQLTYALSTDGQQYGFSYDDKGNVTKAEITARKPATTLESGKEYYVINSYSGLALDSYWAGNSGDTASTFRFTPGSSEQIWKLELVSGTTDVFRLKTMVAPSKNLYLDVRNGLTAHGTMMQIANSNSSSAQKFKIVKERDNTFSLFTGNTNYEKLVDGQYHGNEIIQSEEVYQTNPYPNKEEPCYGQRWYFYPVENSVDKTIATETAYTDSKNFVKSTKDQRGNETTYAYNEQKGTLTSTIDALGRTTNYTYDPNNNSLLSVSSGGMTNSYAYENDRLKNITVNGGLQYAFQYDAFGRTTSTKVGNGTAWRTLSSLEYNDKGLLGKQTYGNGDYIDFTYDNLDRITEKKYNGSNTSRVQYAYDSEGRTSAIKDIENSRYTRFTYDLAGRVVRNVTYPNAAANSAFITDMRYNYESKTNRLSDFTYRMPKHGSTAGDYRTADFELIYGTGADADRITALQMHKVNRIQFAYDGFGRVTSRTYSNTTGDNRRVTTYTYQDVGADKTTTLLKTVNNSGFGLLGYEYDAVGNITQITKDGTVQESYTYDDLNQLKTVTRNGVTTEYNYQNGNITSVTQNGTAVKTYGYTDSTWSDLLTNFNGQTITYDDIGNPLQYRDGMSFTWAKGRQLQGITKDGLNASYTYDENGLRISKTVNGVTTKIFRTNGQMVGMNMSDGKDMTFILDGDGNVYGVHYDHYSASSLRSETYYFAYNAQGDVIGIYDFSGRLMATYDYDEWGNCTVNVLAADSNGHAIDSPDHIAHVNPFRYRGYFYDAETGFYYLNSRYYDPSTGRFVNGDNLLGANQDILSNNIFAYCSNNPVNCFDASGNGKIWNWFKENVVNPIKETIGAAFNYNSETSNDFLYGFWFSIENGYGYDKTFDTGKPINAFAAVNTDKGMNSSASVGIDANFSGYGASLQSGTSTAISIHLKENHIELGLSSFGRNYIKYSYINDLGAEVYTTLYINNFEIAATVLVAIYAPETIPIIVSAGAKLAEQGA